MTNENQENEAKLFRQLAAIKHRLETFPFSSHEVKCVRDALIVLIRTVAGEVIESAQPVKVVPAGESVMVGNQQLTGGVEIAPGVMVYHGGSISPSNPSQPAQPATDDRGGVLIDVGAGRPYDPIHNPRGVKPIPGSLMAKALGIPDPEPTVGPNSNGGGI